MSPLQKVAMGLVIVVLAARFGGYDALPDPVGWGLVLAGTWPLRRVLPSGDVATWLAAVAAVVSVPLVLPAVDHRLSASGQWGLSLPQTGFCLVLAGGLATLTAREEAREARAFRLLRTAYVVVLVGPVLVYGGGVVELRTPVAVLAVLSNAALVWYTFAVSRRSYVAGPARPGAPGSPGAPETPEGARP